MKKLLIMAIIAMGNMPVIAGEPDTIKELKKKVIELKKEISGKNNRPIKTYLVEITCQHCDYLNTLRFLATEDWNSGSFDCKNCRTNNLNRLCWAQSTQYEE